MAEQPCVSIGMPLYNAEKFLEETLDSVLAQTFGDFELIISDNASTDGTASICQSYMSRDPRIRYVRNKVNLGAAFNYNRTFELSSGKYFKWAPGDDVYSPDYLAKCVSVLDKHPEVILCYPRTTIINERGEAIGKAIHGPDLSSSSVTKRFRLAVLNISHCNAVVGLIRSAVLRKTRLIQNYTPSDRVLLMELTLYGQFFELSEYLFFRRKHPAASGHIKTIEMEQEFFDPKTRGKVFLFSWNLVLQNLAIVGRAPVGPSQKAHRMLSIAREMITERKGLIVEPFVALKQLFQNLLGV